MVQYREDQQAILTHFEQLKQVRGNTYRPTVAHYEGNAQAPITHPKGDASKFARSGLTIETVRVLQPVCLQ